jgi:methionyl aminopeptidase
MSITREDELIGMKKVSIAVACTLREMCSYAKPGLSTKQLDTFGAKTQSTLGTKLIEK